MSNDLTIIQGGDDGWSDAAAESAERVLKGTLLKFADRMWSAGKEGTPIEDGRQLVALSTAAGWVRWTGGKPSEYLMRQPGRSLPQQGPHPAVRSACGRSDRRDLAAKLLASGMVPPTTEGGLSLLRGRNVTWSFTRGSAVTVRKRKNPKVCRRKRNRASPGG
jgi:hypothetical protein